MENQPNQPVQEQNQRLSPFSGNSNKLKHWAIIAFVAIAAGAAVWYFGNKNHVEDSGPIVKHQEDELKDWKTYVNQEYGFEFKYPPKFLENNNSSQMVSFQNEDRSAEMQVWLFPEATSSPYPEFLVAEGLIQLDKMSINGTDWYYLDDNDEDGPRSYYQAKLNEGVIHIRFYGFDSPTVSLILPTFKFISNTSESPTKWPVKNYRNSKYGFEFQYPDLGSSTSIRAIEDDDGLTAIVFLTPLDSIPNAVIENFRFTISNNPEKLSLHDWFEKYIDEDGLLLEAATFTEATFKNVTGLELTGSIPLEWKGGPIYTIFFTITPFNDYIIAFSIAGQDNDLAKYGYGGTDGYDRLITEVLSTLKFTNN